MLCVLLIVLFSGCLKLNDNPPVEVERYQMGNALVNGKPYEHVVYFSQFGSVGNPFLRSSSSKNMVYFPIILSPANGDEYTGVEYAIVLCINAKGGVPMLNKPYTITRSLMLETTGTSDEILRLFMYERQKLLVNGTEGIAVVYDYANRTRSSADGTITFTSFDLEKKSCTGFYTFKIKDSKDAIIEFRDGTIATRITKEFQEF